MFWPLEKVPTTSPLLLTATDWSVPEAAQILDVSRSQIYNLIRMFELKRD